MELFLKVCFWTAISVVFYTYIGYGIVAWVWAKSLSKLRKGEALAPFEPEVTLIVPAYNEACILESKIKDCLALSYPAAKLRIMFITDGSTDKPEAILAKYPRIQHLHIATRGGKSLAENRAMEHVRTPFVIFTDCNTYLNREAVREMVKHYQDPAVGAVSGEKKVMTLDSLSGSGEGLYWKYESFLKRCDSDIHSLMGAAGELVSFRTSLYQPLEADTILDDFVQSLRIVEKGYKVVYEPQAFAMEDPSNSMADEMKRKIRICAGGWQSMVRLKSLLLPFRQPVVTFLYISHRVLRWSLTPALLALLLPLNLGLAYLQGGLYTWFFVAQLLFYAAAWVAWLADAKGHKLKPLLVPLYFTMMNVAVFAGFLRYIRKAQPAAWEKAERNIHTPAAAAFAQDMRKAS
ncbi:glycosyltransferase family 2 protein [Pontibacter akesuensis]|uniref:Glycosyltransferase, catalytic subunit of cellulose synthase and poly-beta-1,6-N-acetylglucosamine synthase n=1 Tax=Pontibacter akesuensis TaxID=388950 RepID=A0A1I7GHB4_9BACT|nr:glycosyltransferase family 2 protein [Pontibacter akesuensis]SFU47823.1 Glycosyltransferase, catalytic subunit of cellulose synthase and poly-beta-1,6-N-acetylglucosamine synthase [Pontibacter akesuensis]